MTNIILKFILTLVILSSSAMNEVNIVKNTSIPDKDIKWEWGGAENLVNWPE